MPELPEVETIKNDLLEKVLNKKIIKIKADKKIIGESVKNFEKKVKNSFFINIDRMGKLLIFELDNKFYLLVHLKMTGQLVYVFKNEMVAGGHPLSKNSFLKAIGGDLPNKHTRVVFSFSDKSKLFFNDMRKFGYVRICDKDELEKIKAKYGPDSLNGDFNVSSFREALKTKTGKIRDINIKTFLLNQEIVAGIGNIYADEILFKSKILPTRKVSKLDDKDVTNVVKATKQILEKAVKHRGTTFSDYVDSGGRSGGFARFLKVYGREGEKCVNCQGLVKKAKVAGRGTHYCDQCQI